MEASNLEVRTADGLTDKERQWRARLASLPPAPPPKNFTLVGGSGAAPILASYEENRCIEHKEQQKFEMTELVSAFSALHLGLPSDSPLNIYTTVYHRLMQGGIPVLRLRLPPIGTSASGISARDRQSERTHREYARLLRSSFTQIFRPST
eukprot:1195111-Prorocentrum_minimum.AAC.7